jgi:hypothetical protein
MMPGMPPPGLVPIGQGCARVAQGAMPAVADTIARRASESDAQQPSYDG